MRTRREVARSVGDLYPARSLLPLRQRAQRNNDHQTGPDALGSGLGVLPRRFVAPRLDDAPSPTKDTKCLLARTR
jgi:hypothetical protein